MIRQGPCRGCVCAGPGTPSLAVATRASDETAPLIPRGNVAFTGGGSGGNTMSGAVCVCARDDTVLYYSGHFLA